MAGAWFSGGVVASEPPPEPASPAESVVAEPAEAEDTPSLGERVASIQHLTVRDALTQIAAWRIPIMLTVAGAVVVFLILADVLLPGGLRRSGLRDVTPYPWLMWVFVGLIVLLAMPMAADMVSRYGVLVGDGSEPLRHEAVVTSLGTVAAVIVAIGLIYLLARGAPEAGLRFKPMDLLVGLGCLLLAYPLVEAAAIGGESLHRAFSDEPVPMIAHDTLERLIEHRSSPWALLLIAAVVIGVPIWEELAFRMGFQSALLRLFGSPWPAIVLTGVLFGLIHRLGPTPVPWHAIPALTMLGIAMGVAYERTRRLGVPIVMHAGFNGLNVAMALSLGSSS